MSCGDKLLQEIEAHPNDDILRLVYADWLEEQGDAPRAEFIRIQIEAKEHFRSTREHTHLLDRLIELLTRHGQEWSRGYGLGSSGKAVVWTSEDQAVFQQGSKRLWFRRGFVDALDLDPESFLSLRESELCLEGPQPLLILSPRYSCDAASGHIERDVPQLAATPLLRRFRGISIRAGFTAFDDAALCLLANQPVLLEKLEGLHLSEDPVSDEGLLPVLESPLLTRLRELVVDYTDCTEAVVQVLLRSDRFRGMEWLWFEDIFGANCGVRTFARPGSWPALRVLTLGCCGLEDLSLKGLMRPGAFPSLEDLDLYYNPIHYSTFRSMILSEVFPRLRRLGVGGTGVTEEEFQALRAEFGPRIDIGPVRRKRRPAEASVGSASDGSSQES